MNKTIFGILLALMANQAALASEFPFTLHKLGQDIRLAMFNNKILYDIDKARKRIGYVPIKKGIGDRI